MKRMLLLLVLFSGCTWHNKDEVDLALIVKLLEDAPRKIKLESRVYQFEGDVFLGSNLILYGDPNDKPIIRGRRPFGTRGGSNITIRNLRFEFIENGPFHLELYGSDLSVDSCEFVGKQPKHGAIVTGGENIRIYKNRFELEDAGGTQDHAIYLNVGRGRTLTKNIEVSENYILGPRGYGIHIFEQSESTGTQWSMSDIRVINNIIHDSIERSGLIVAHGSGGSISNVLIESNRSSGNAYAGFVVRNGKDITFIDNTATENPPTDFQVPVTQSGNSWQTGEPPTDPPPDGEPPIDGLPIADMLERAATHLDSSRLIINRLLERVNENRD